MRVLRRPVALLVMLLPLAAPVLAQVGVETGLTTAGSAGAIEPLRRLGSAVNRSVFGSAGAVATVRAAAPVTSAFSVSAAAPTAARTFAPPAAGRYVAGVSWRQPGTTPVVLTAAGQEVSGTTAAPLLLRFETAGGGPVTVGIRASGVTAAGGVSGSLDVVREVAPGEMPTKSLLSPVQRAEEARRRGPRHSLLPLLANLAARRLRGASPETDLDQLFARAVTAAGSPAAEDLQALVQGYDTLPETVRGQSFTAQTAALRTVEHPTRAAVAGLLAPPPTGTGFSGGLVNAPPRLTGLLPELPPGGAYAPGAVLRLVGENLGPRIEDNRVHLGPTLSRLLSTEPLPVRSASPTALEFQLPAELPDGPLYLLVVVRYKHPTSAKTLRVSKDGLNPAAGASAGDGGARYRLCCRQLECVDETDPEWWSDDRVVLVVNGVADGEALTRAFSPAAEFRDGVAVPLGEGDRVLLDHTVSRGLGLVAELWRRNPPVEGGLDGWALREAFANLLVAPEPQYGDPKPQDEVAAEFAIEHDPIGWQQLSWSATELAQLLQPGQTREIALDLRQGSTPQQWEASGHYRLSLSLERVQ